jgi:hypothetical protein
MTAGDGAGQTYGFRIASSLRASAERVRTHAGTFAGVNRELWPLARMTYPAAIARLAPGAFPVGRTAFRSRILLFGLLPVEYDDFRLAELDPGVGFQEVSRLWAVREWRHRRRLRPAAGGRGDGRGRAGAPEAGDRAAAGRGVPGRVRLATPAAAAAVRVTRAGPP